MKTLFTKLLAVAVAVLVSTATFSQDTLLITYDATSSPECDEGGTVDNLEGESQVYIHSGAGLTDTTGWEYVIGNWGVDDGIGEMTSTGTDLWEIKIALPDYYDAASNGPIPSGDSVHSIGLVFRNADGSKVGKDKECSDIFIRGIYSGDITVTHADDTEFDGVTAELLNVSGIEDLAGSFSNITAYPNPVGQQTTIKYALNEQIDNLEIKVMDALGRTISNLHHGSQTSGTHTVSWDASNVNSGIYFYTFSNGKSVVTKKLLVTK